MHIVVREWCQTGTWVDKGVRWGALLVWWSGGNILGFMSDVWFGVSWVGAGECMRVGEGVGRWELGFKSRRLRGTGLVPEWTLVFDNSVGNTSGIQASVAATCVSGFQNCVRSTVISVKTQYTCQQNWGPLCLELTQGKMRTPWHSNNPGIQVGCMWRLKGNYQESILHRHFYWQSKCVQSSQQSQAF